MVYHGTPMLAAFLKGQLALVYLDTLVLAPKFFIPSINTPQCIFGKMMQNCEWKFVGKSRENSEEKIEWSQERERERERESEKYPRNIIIIK